MAERHSFAGNLSKVMQNKIIQLYALSDQAHVLWGNSYTIGIIKIITSRSFSDEILTTNDCVKVYNSILILELQMQIYVFVFFKALLPALSSFII